jgi:hypothetical protein
MSVCAADAWSIARFCALVVLEAADDDALRRSLIRIRDVWIDTANECELYAGRGKTVPEGSGRPSSTCARRPGRIANEPIPADAVVC